MLVTAVPVQYKTTRGLRGRPGAVGVEPTSPTGLPRRIQLEEPIPAIHGDGYVHCSRPVDGRGAYIRHTRGYRPTPTKTK